MGVDVLHGDCRGELTVYAPDTFDSVCTDPPYGLVDPRSGGSGPGRGTGVAFCPRTDEQKAKRRGGFMGKAWDAEVPGVDVWTEVLRVLKPGGYMLAMGGTRTYHRLACAVEDAGFELRDCLMWMYGSGFPKGQGCLKPAWEPILLARKLGPRVLPLGIDGCRVPTDGEQVPMFMTSGGRKFEQAHTQPERRTKCVGSSDIGRYPANVVHDGSDEVMEAFAAFGEKTSGKLCGVRRAKYAFGSTEETGTPLTGFGDTRTAARFFYCAKAAKSERGEGNTHPTVKPLSLMRWMVRLVTPEGGRVLDPFAGSGSTLVAAQLEGRDAVGVELDWAHCEIIKRRLAAAVVPEDLGLFQGV